ncbi:related to ATP-dependent RNA helicase CHL1 [Saccharomycodes ludwigii]|uniref:ATP-dependent DNA helicase CHL1 n=1 Tax=Saccharomycodes ludwigii TaxID=36035 RepID=A0A376B691_9ASCO|nr:hypothetical protein SCDLUD_000559 [Saccharomycodes ludwigii]KAH3902959.1 hypothetical protein SCDLUD_000559 [Saccharomycodes ludwigii]SSD60151.1 related to ATP-dependent RNA helicase CHL1 [Saccharomycodes ludwigii]
MSKKFKTKSMIDKGLNYTDNDSIKNYNHPYEPYHIQMLLMDHIYKLLDNDEQHSKIGIFESPTGTGKTLSLICSTMTWLRNNKKKALSSSTESITASLNNHPDDEDTEPEWVKQSYKDDILNEKINNFKILEDSINKFEKTISNGHSSSAVFNSLNETQNLGIVKKRKLQHIDIQISKDESDTNEDNQFILDNNAVEDTSKTKIQLEIQTLLSKLDDKNNNNNNITNNLQQPIQILYASRTHSQLQQFSSQLTLLEHNKTKFPSSIFPVSKEKIKYLPLGSRKQLCINPKVTKLNNTELINEACKNLIQSHDCVYYENIDNLPMEAIFNEIIDIEDLNELGRKYKSCPYYFNRHIINLAEIITLPYQLLLMESARESLNIHLKNSIIIIDEAHNLIDTIMAVNKSVVNLSDLAICISSLKLYLAKFKKKLNASNRVNLLILIKFLNNLCKFIVKNFKINKQVNPNDILQYENSDKINFHDLLAFIKATKLPYKLQSYIMEQDKSQQQINKGTPLLFKISKFLQSLTNPSVEGVFYFSGENQLEYMLLEPSEIFKSITENCFKLILCGGTMEPMNEFKEKLFPYVPPEKIMTFSCDHVISDNNLQVFIEKDSAVNDINRSIFEFTFGKRNDFKMLESLGTYLLNLFKVIPDGVVLFCPSYQFLQTLMDFWQKCPNDHFFKLNQLKKIYSESFTKTNTSDSPLNKYQERILIDRKPAALFAVVGGKLSEGINFQDNLARAVIMIGLPYPNIFQSDMVIQREHIMNKYSDNKKLAITETKNYLDNICMRAVNQSVGRSIRHVNDYSCIYLLDKRYNNPNIKNKLSGWVKKRIVTDNYQYKNLSLQEYDDKIINSTRKFFFQKKLE